MTNCLNAQRNPAQMCKIMQTIYLVARGVSRWVCASGRPLANVSACVLKMFTHRCSYCFVGRPKSCNQTRTGPGSIGILSVRAKAVLTTFLALSSNPASSSTQEPLFANFIPNQVTALSSLWVFLFGRQVTDWRNTATNWCGMCIASLLNLIMIKITPQKAKCLYPAQSFELYLLHVSTESSSMILQWFRFFFQMPIFNI